MKKQVKTFPSVEKFFARLFHSHCCLTCLYLDVKEKECWAPWTFEKSGCSRVSSSVEGKAGHLGHYFDYPATSNVWDIGSECKAWR